MTLYTTTGKLTPIAPFDFTKSLEFIGHFRPAMGEQHIDKISLTKSASFNGQCIVFRIQSTGTSDAPQLTYNLFSDAEITDSLHESVRDRITFFLSLNDDLRPLYELGQADP